MPMRICTVRSTTSPGFGCGIGSGAGAGSSMLHAATENSMHNITRILLREFLYVDDLADLCVFLMNNYSGNETVNAGSGKELSIKELTNITRIL